MKDLSNLKKELEAIGKESIEYLKRILEENDKRATGELINSLDYKVVEVFNSFFLTITAAEQFKYVDQGRRPGAKQPPLNPIEVWVKQRNIVFKDLSSRSTAFLIARSIGEKGIRPLHLKDKMIQNIIEKKEELLLTATLKDIDDYINTIFF